MIQSDQGQAAALEIISKFSQGQFPKALDVCPRHGWLSRCLAGDDRRRRGLQRSRPFTAFIGYEWTSLNKGNNLHRNVIFRDNGDRASQVEPMTCTPPLGSTNPIDLWKWMDAYEKKTGGSVLALAHNGNLSNGEMFPTVEAFGKAIDREYCRAARQMGAALRNHANEGRRRSTSLPLAER